MVSHHHVIIKKKKNIFAPAPSVNSSFIVYLLLEIEAHQASTVASHPPPQRNGCQSPTLLPCQWMRVRESGVIKHHGTAHHSKWLISTGGGIAPKCFMHQLLGHRRKRSSPAALPSSNPVLHLRPKHLLH